MRFHIGFGVMNLNNPDPVLRVLIVGNFLSHHGGSRGVCEDLAERLRDEGAEVVTTSSHKNRFMRVFHMLFTTLKMRKSYSVAQVDVYSGLAFWWAELICMVLRFLGKPYIITLHGGNLPAFSRKQPSRVRRFMNVASVVVAPSDYLLTEMAPYRSDIVLLANPIALDHYPFRPRTNATPALVWMRAFHSVYNPALLVRVIALLNSEWPEIRGVMAGPDKGDGSLQEVQKLAKNLGISSHLSFPGGVPKSEVPHLLSSGDIFVNTTDADNTPVSVLEAMACGLPVITTNVGGIAYLLCHEHDALLVPPNDPEAMAMAVRRLLTEPGLAEKLSCNARAKAGQHDWSQVLPVWMSMLHELAGTAKAD